MKRLILILLLFCSPLYAQTQPVPTTEKTLGEINASLDSIQTQLDDLLKKKHVLERDRLLLIEKIASDQKKSAYEGGPIIVVRVSGERSVILLINGREQEVSLAGVMVKMGYSDQAVAFLSRALLVGIVYPKCADPSCYEVELYSSKDKPSLNCQLAESGIALLVGKKDMGCNGGARPLAEVTIDDSNIPDTRPSTSPKPVPGTEVQVKGYYRKDGTYVKPHTRSAPRRKN